MTSKKKEKLSFSKIFVIFAMICFVITLIELPILLLLNIDIDSFASQQLITVGALLASTFTVYGWKERIFNITRLKMELIKWQWEFKESHKLNEEQFEEIKEQTNSIDEAIENKMDNIIEETINEAVSISHE